MKTIIIISILLINILSLPAQDDALQKSTGAAETRVFYGIPLQLQNECTQFFKLLMISEIDEAFDKLLKNSPIAQKDEQVKNLVLQTKRSIKLYGDLRGYEPVSSEIVSPSLMRLRYLGLHSDSPMRWIFTFYNSPVRGWIVINIKFDDLAEFYFSDQ